MDGLGKSPQQTEDRSSAGILRALMEHVPEGITIAYGQDAIIHSVSRHGLRLIEREAAEVTQIGAEAHPDAWQVYHLDGETRVAAADLPLTRACRGATVEGEELLIRSSTGRVFPILCNAGPIYGPDGEVVGGIIAWRDNTATYELLREKELLAREAEMARADAERADRAKDLLLAKLAHEMRTPLSAIKNWTQIARTRAMQPEDLARAFTVIERNVAMQERLVHDLMDANRIVSGKIELDLAPADIEDVVQAVVDSLAGKAHERGIALVADLEPIRITADSVRLQQVITNLVGNAIKFSADGGTVRVLLKRSTNIAHLCVIDGGRGLRAEDVARVFEPFWQADGTQEGLGLGLSIAKQLTELHGGTLSVGSEGEGKGCCFEVWLPSAEATETPL